MGNLCQPTPLLTGIGSETSCSLIPQQCIVILTHLTRIIIPASWILDASSLLFLMDTTVDRSSDSFRVLYFARPYTRPQFDVTDM